MLKLFKLICWEANWGCIPGCVISKTVVHLYCLKFSYTTQRVSYCTVSGISDTKYVRVYTRNFSEDNVCCNILILKQFNFWWNPSIYSYFTRLWINTYIIGFYTSCYLRPRGEVRFWNCHKNRKVTSYEVNMKLGSTIVIKTFWKKPVLNFYCYILLQWLQGERCNYIPNRVN